jgi:5-oxopent-3-ene-1,2,5-tricarboxylate decarboxylase/2-hydroxyhepta-2,4-diene-1,7-dioate isomerase
MEPGDVVEVEIDGLARLSSAVVESDVELTGPGALPNVTADTIHVALAVPQDEAERLAARADVA